MRTKMSFELICSVCGKTLECDVDPKVDGNRVIFNSAFTAEGKMSIIPCRHCLEEAQRPIRLIRQALQLPAMKNGERQ